MKVRLSSLAHGLWFAYNEVALENDHQLRDNFFLDHGEYSHVGKLRRGEGEKEKSVPRTAAAEETKGAKRKWRTAMRLDAKRGGEAMEEAST